MRISDWSSDVCSSDLRDDQGDARRVRRHGVYGRFRRPRAHSRNMPMTATRMRGCALREIEAARRRGCKRGLPGAAWYRAWKCWMSSARLPARKPRSPHRIPNSRGIAYTSFWRWEEVGRLVRLDSQQTAPLRRSDRERFSAAVQAFVEEIGRASCRERVCQYV